MAELRLMVNSKKMNFHGRRLPAMLVKLLLPLVLATTQNVRADSQHDVLVFLSLEEFKLTSATDPTLEGSNTLATADFLYTYNSDRFRFLAEYIWSNSESELERFQGAWEFDDETILWFGRFHAISNYWTTEYHHGQFMQTSISRPGLEEWEDESGPMPSHITGLWLEHEFSVNTQSALNLGLSAGLAPKFEGEQLAPFDLLDPTSGHGLSVSGRLAYHPDVLSISQIGLTVSNNDIEVVSDSNPNLTDLNTIQQLTYGVFAHWQWKDWRLSTNWMYFDIDMLYTSGEVKDKFLLAYVQVEYDFSEDWTVFGRTEFGDGEDDSHYLQLLPRVIAHRQMLGLRWNVADSHALTLEIADTSVPAEENEHQSFKELRIQWSAVFP